MNDGTQFVSRVKGESHIMSLSVRAFIAIAITLTICAMSLQTQDIKEPLYSLGIAVVAFYMGQNTKPKSQLQP